jgi:hypothetical protein
MDDLVKLEHNFFKRKYLSTPTALPIFSTLQTLGFIRPMIVK